jgi:hypothetical protein
MPPLYSPRNIYENHVERAGVATSLYLDLYWEDARFEFRPGHPLYLGSLWFSFVPPGKCQDSTSMGS